VACDAYYLQDGQVGPGRFMERFPPPPEPSLATLLTRNFVYVSALFPRSVGEELGWFDPDLFGTEDYDLWIRIAEAGYDLVVVPEPLGIYRVSPGSVSSAPARQARTLELVYEKALARGRLAPAERRVAVRMLRRTRAVRVVAEDWIESDAPLPRRLGALARHAPMLASTALREPSSWGFWLRELRRR
jgi:GT2 family glycosyltransferase